MLLCYGVWFQLFISTTVHYKLPEHDSTNLRGDKCKNGQSYCEYINDCLPPNVVCEKCNLNEIECESVNNSTSCVTPKHFNRRESEWQWCGDGRCVHVETPCGRPPCKHNEFLCGGECKSQEYQDQFRTCGGKCVKRDEHCLKEPVIMVTVVPAAFNQTKPNQTVGSLGWAALIMLAIVLVMLAIVLVMLAIFGVCYFYKKCTDSAGEMDRDMSTADTLDASMNDVHPSTITVPSTATASISEQRGGSIAEDARPVRAADRPAHPAAQLRVQVPRGPHLPPQVPRLHGLRHRPVGHSHRSSRMCNGAHEQLDPPCSSTTRAASTRCSSSAKNSTKTTDRTPGTSPRQTGSLATTPTKTPSSWCSSLTSTRRRTSSWSSSLCQPFSSSSLDSSSSSAAVVSTWTARAPWASTTPSAATTTTCSSTWSSRKTAGQRSYRNISSTVCEGIIEEV